MYRIDSALLESSSLSQQQLLHRPQNQKQTWDSADNTEAMRVTILSLVVLCVLSLYHYSIEFMESEPCEESSETSLQTNSISKNNNILKNLMLNRRVFDYSQTQPSKRTEIVQCRKCDKTLQLKGLNKYYIHKRNQEKRYNVATKDSVWSTITHKQTKSKKQGQLQRESNQIHTKTITKKPNSGNNTSITNNNSNNISSSNHNSSDSSNNRNNIDNINAIIDDNDNVGELHVAALLDNEYKQLIEETDTKSTSSNVRIDIGTKIDNIYNNNERHPNIYNFNAFYERYKSFEWRYTCIDNDIYSFECIVCCKSVMNGKTYNLTDD